MTRRHHTNRNLSPTAPLDVQFSSFSLGDHRLPYMTSIMTADRCREDLTLASDNPAFTLAQGRVEELFQRDIDYERVSHMAKHYLAPNAQRQGPPFFNSLTVALMVHGSGEKVPPLKIGNDLYEHTKDIGPVRISWDQSDPETQLPDIGAFGFLYWNKLGIQAVAIDGQHRLAAIKRFAERHPAQSRKIGVSVLFLLFHEDFGVKASGSQSELMRQLFIDLNKHAEKVTRGRQLLLDDRDPVAIGIRRTIGSELEFKPTSEKMNGFAVGSDGEFAMKFPLELVDWHGEQRAKVDRGPYAISVLGLEWAYVQLCKSSRFGKLTLDMGKLTDAYSRSDAGDDDDHDYYERVGNLMGPWASRLPEIKAQISDARDNESPYSPPRETLAKMGALIADQWAQPLVTLLSLAGPYKALADYRVKHGLLTSKFGSWYQAVSAYQSCKKHSAKDQISANMSRIEQSLDEEQAGTSKRFKECVAHIETEIKQVAGSKGQKEPNLLFSLTGQRALIKSLVWAFDSARNNNSCETLAEELGRPIPDSDSARATLLAQLLASTVSAFSDKTKGGFFTKNHVCKSVPGLALPQGFWHGSILNRDREDEIDFSARGAQRGSAVFAVMLSAWLVRQSSSKQQASKIHSAISKWLASGRDEDLVPLEGSACARLLRRALPNCFGVEDFLKERPAPLIPIAWAAQGRPSEQVKVTPKQFTAYANERFMKIWGTLD
jgi:hypothetical protein